MGKVRTRTIGLEDVEREQKKKQKDKSKEKKVARPPKAQDIQDKKSAEREVKKVSKEALSQDTEKAADQTLKSQEKPTAKTKKIKAKVRGRKYQGAKLKIDRGRLYSLSDALQLLREIKYAAFDESVELHLNTEIEGLRGEVALPHPTGKTIKVAVVDEAVLASIESGKIDFDILVSHPSYMPRLAKHAKVLGPRGLMPNPKTGTISDKPEEILKKFSSGTLRWKSEAKAPLIHLIVGKISFEDKKLTDNIDALVKSIGRQNMKEVFLKTTMSPSLKLDINQL